MYETSPEIQTLVNPSEQFRDASEMYHEGKSMSERGCSDMLAVLEAAKGQTWPLKALAVVSVRYRHQNERGQIYHEQFMSDETELEARQYTIRGLGEFEGRPTIWLAMPLIRNVENQVLIEGLSLATIEELAEVKKRSVRPSNVTTT